ncbi:MAG: gamma-glutamylcyclotransferase family protein [Nitrospiria bacterium]
MYYFTYGSNLDCVQMRERCPSARFHGIAQLKDHRLAFSRLSQKRKCGVADAVSALGHSIWGVVYEISDTEVIALDSKEGFNPNRPINKNSYVRNNCNVLIDGNERKSLFVWTYFAIKQQNPPLPDEKYKKLIIDGAKFWKLPEEYVKELEQIQVG